MPDQLGERLGRSPIELGMPVAGLQKEIVARDAKPGAECLKRPPDVEDVREPIDLLRIRGDILDLAKARWDRALRIPDDLLARMIAFIGPGRLI